MMYAADDVRSRPKYFIQEVIGGNNREQADHIMLSELTVVAREKTQPQNNIAH